MGHVPFGLRHYDGGGADQSNLANQATSIGPSLLVKRPLVAEFSVTGWSTVRPYLQCYPISPYRTTIRLSSAAF